MEHSTTILLIPLLPIGKFAKQGKYEVDHPTRQLRFEINIGTVTRRDYETLEEKEFLTFRMTGSRSEKRSGDQGIERLIEDFFDRVPKDKQEDLMRLVNIWREYHMNDFMPGTKDQIDALHSRIGGGVASIYSDDVRYLQEKGLLVDRGYRYGSSWLVKKIPEKDVQFIEEICKKWGVYTDGIHRCEGAA